MYSFKTSPIWARLAILECAQHVIDGIVTPNKIIVFRYGNGMWINRGYSDQFNSGCNMFESESYGKDYRGALPLGDMNSLEQWFYNHYNILSQRANYNFQPFLRKDKKNEWNFHMDHQQQVLNFHMMVL